MKNIVTKIREYYPMSDEALQAMLDCMTPMHYPKDTVLVHSGRKDGKVYFIEEGVTRSIFHNGDKDTTTWFSCEGDITFGMYSLYHGNPSIESVETLTNCLIYSMPIDSLNALYERYIDIANWGRVIHQECNAMLSLFFVERLQLTPKERYQMFLKHYPGLVNRVKLKYIAEFLGISIYTLSRVRGEI